MGVFWVEASMLTQFVDDLEAFEKCVNEHFCELDSDRDGVISIDDLTKRSGKYASREFELQSVEEITNMYNTLFEKFDTDQNGILDQEEFRSMMKEIVLAKARGIGESPVFMVLQGNSFVKRAVDYNLAKYG